MLFLIVLHLFLYTPLEAAAKISVFRMTNGLRVILAPNEYIESTCVLLYHTTGVRDDPASIKGGSYLYQNLMLGKTDNLGRYERLLYINRNGGISNRLVSYDYSIFYQIVPESEVNNALWLESERISSLHLTQQEVNAEKSNVYTRNYRLSTNSLNVRTFNWCREKVFQGTLYETPIYGKLQEIRGFNAQSVINLYSNFQNLNNIIMVVAGKFDAQEIRRTISKHFAALASPQPKSKPKKSYTMIGPRTQFLFENRIEKNIDSPFAIYGLRTPSKLSFDYLIFDFLRYYLMDERISKLEEILNRDNHLNAHIDYQYTNNYEANALIIKITCKTRINLERSKYFINKLFSSIIKGKPGTISKDDIKNTKTLMEIDFHKMTVSLEKWSAFLAENYHLSGALNADELYLNRLRNIDSYAIYRIAQKYFAKENRVNLNVYQQK